MGAKQTDRDGYDLTFENITGREYIYLLAALEDQHENVHRAEESGYAQPVDIAAVHKLLTEVEHDALEAEAHEVALDSFERMVDAHGAEGIDFGIGMNQPTDIQQDGIDVDDFEEFDGTDIDIE